MQLEHNLNDTLRLSIEVYIGLAEAAGCTSLSFTEEPAGKLMRGSKFVVKLTWPKEPGSDQQARWQRTEDGFSKVCKALHKQLEALVP